MNLDIKKRLFFQCKIHRNMRFAIHRFTSETVSLNSILEYPYFDRITMKIIKTSGNSEKWTKSVFWSPRFCLHQYSQWSTMGDELSSATKCCDILQIMTSPIKFHKIVLQNRDIEINESWFGSLLSSTMLMRSTILLSMKAKKRVLLYDSIYDYRIMDTNRRKAHIEWIFFNVFAPSKIVHEQIV